MLRPSWDRHTETNTLSRRPNAITPALVTPSTSVPMLCKECHGYDDDTAMSVPSTLVQFNSCWTTNAASAIFAVITACSSVTCIAITTCSAAIAVLCCHRRLLLRCHHRAVLPSPSTVQPHRTVDAPDVRHRWTPVRLPTTAIVTRAPQPHILS